MTSPVNSSLESDDRDVTVFVFESYLILIFPQFGKLILVTLSPRSKCSGLCGILIGDHFSQGLPLASAFVVVSAIIVASTVAEIVTDGLIGIQDFTLGSQSSLVDKLFVDFILKICK